MAAHLAVVGEVRASGQAGLASAPDVQQNLASLGRHRAEAGGRVDAVSPLGDAVEVEADVAAGRDADLVVVDGDLTQRVELLEDEGRVTVVVRKGEVVVRTAAAVPAFSTA